MILRTKGVYLKHEPAVFREGGNAGPSRASLGSCGRGGRLRSAWPSGRPGAGRPGCRPRPPRGAERLSAVQPEPPALPRGPDLPSLFPPGTPRGGRRDPPAPAAPLRGAEASPEGPPERGPAPAAAPAPRPRSAGRAPAGRHGGERGLRRRGRHGGGFRRLREPAVRRGEALLQAAAGDLPGDQGGPHPLQG